MENQFSLLTDAIFASSLTRSMALKINELAIQEIGKNGIVYLTVQKFIFREGLPIEYLRFESVSKALAFILRQWRRISTADQYNIKECLVSLGIFDDCKKSLGNLRRS